MYKEMRMEKKMWKLGRKEIDKEGEMGKCKEK